MKHPKPPRAPTGRPRGRPRKPASGEGAPQATFALPVPAGPRPTPLLALPKAVYSSHLAPARVTEVYDSYWHFAVERQRVFFRRLAGARPPWTEDSVIGGYRFTNAYRASDRVSQYLIRKVIYREDLPSSDEEVFFRILIFKLFNKIETWELLEAAFGAVTWADYRFDLYDAALTRALRGGTRIYSAAYIMPPGGSTFGHPAKHQNHLRLLEAMMRAGVPARLRGARRMQQAFDLLRSFPTVGDFLAYQFVTDINYSLLTDFSEMEFVVPGPGARDGLSKCFASGGGLNEAELIRLVADRQEEEFERLGLDFPSLWGRRLQLIDCQNLFCEISKYARVAHPEVSGVAGRTRIKQRFAPSAAPLAPPWYPPKWGLDTSVAPSAAEQRAEIPTIASRRPTMDMRTYQREARATDRVPLTASGNVDPVAGLIVPLLGLAGETGQLLSEYKKHLRDRDAHLMFKERVAEELGDLLWYVANVASKFDLDLAEIAAANLEKTQGRWGARPDAPHAFDEGYPERERFPRRFEVEMFETMVKGEVKLRVLLDGAPLGADLTDNAYDPDGYRFHDVFHLSLVAVLGWSPVVRALMKRKRKSRPKVDEVEDGGRAQVIEEGVSALVFDYARAHGFLEGIRDLDYDLLKTVASMTRHLEVSQCSLGDWQRAILSAYAVWREVVKHNGGRVLVDLDQRAIRFLGASDAGATAAVAADA